MRRHASVGLAGLLLFLLFVITTPLASFGQETDPPEGTRISAAQVSGLDFDRLSPGLREAISNLTGTPLDRQRLRDLAARLEAEQPRYVTAIRTALGSDGTARVTFVVARVRDQGRDTNVNAKYVVERVDVRGVSRGALSPALRQELDALRGKPLDSDAAERGAESLRAAFPAYEIERRIARAEREGTLRVIYTLRRLDWARYLRYEPVHANALYHSDQGWGAVLPLALSGGDVHVMPIVTWSNADDLIEENSGFGIRVESRRLGTERLGLSFDWSTQDVDWRAPTLAALSGPSPVAQPYGHRMSVTPLLKFGFTSQFSVAGGVGITELDPFEDIPGAASLMANVAIGSLRYRQRWQVDSRLEHQVGAVLTLRKGTGDLESDFSYDRYLGEADYLFRSGSQQVLVSALAGRIRGEAPLFERFSLGDSRTLRGWDKYDIVPAGGDRVVHASLEYHVRSAMFFVDAGSVWDAGADRRVRFSTGAGFTPGPLFFTIGFPVNTDEFRAVFTMGFRFGRSPTGVGKFRQ